MDFTPEELQAYLEALKDRVCSLCKKTGYSRSCGIGEYGICPFDLHLPRLLEAVLTTPRSRNIADYVPRIRELVCSQCENQDEKGVCKSRNLASCGLDSLLVLAVQTIEEVYDRLHRPSVRLNCKKRLAGV
ncbi:MAG: hypothetical protein HY717_08290 [Planctomycetes bacterium]|nr:hypothetical protein [Planctomycetota bacterium]